MSMFTALMAQTMTPLIITHVAEHHQVVNPVKVGIASATIFEYGGGIFLSIGRSPTVKWTHSPWKLASRPPFVVDLLFKLLKWV